MKQRLGYFIVAVAVALFSVACWSFGLFSGIENFFHDILFSNRPIPSDIVIVSIDDESLLKMGQWPWKREIFAKAISNLSSAQPAALAVDVLFSEPSRFGSADDLALEQALAAAPFPVVLSAQGSNLIFRDGALHSSQPVAPLPVFSSASSVSLGAVNFLSDRDGVTRRVPVRITFDEGALGSDRFGTLAYNLGAQAIRAAGRWSDDRSYMDVERVVFSGPTGSFARIPFWRLMEGDQSRIAPLLKGKIVFLGVTAPSLHDDQITPVSYGSTMPGVEVQANAANMFLRGWQLRELSSSTQIALILFVVFIPAILFFIFSASVAIPIIATAAVAILNAILLIVLFNRGTLLSVVYTFGALLISFACMIFYRTIVAERNRRDLRRVFSKYVSRAVMDEIMKNPALVKLGGEEREVTVFFSDIRGFTTISEKTTPPELVRILNKYFTAMTAQVLSTGGVVDKYIGDAIMAFWGAPIADPDQADHAMQASLTMLTELKKLNKELVAAGDPEIKIGIGLYTGKAVVGNVGSDQRFDYTVIGDTVNAASRLESANKEYKTQIIFSETTKNALKGSYAIKELGSAQVKGRKEPISIYTIEGTYLEGDPGGDTHEHHG